MFLDCNVAARRARMILAQKSNCFLFVSPTDFTLARISRLRRAIGRVQLFRAMDRRGRE